MPIDSGKRSERIEIYNTGVIVSSSGSETEVLVSPAIRKWASVTPISARLTEIAKSFSESVSYTINILKDTEVKARQKVIWNDITLTIEGVISSDDVMTLYCSSSNNTTLSIVDPDAVVPMNGYSYFGNKNLDGTWRIGQENNVMVLQRRLDGSWITKFEFS